MMKTLFACIAMFLASCTFETHVSGVIVDERTGLPVREVLVRTIKDLNGGNLSLKKRSPLMRVILN